MDCTNLPAGTQSRGVRDTVIEKPMDLVVTPWKKTSAVTASFSKTNHVLQMNKAVRQPLTEKK